MGGEIDGREFGNPTTDLIVVRFGDGHVSFPIDCNEAGAPIDIHESAFGIGLMFTTAVGCGENSDESQLFSEALEDATTIGKDGGRLVLSGESSTLWMVPLEQPQRRGELPLTAAGEKLVIEADPRGLASIFTISMEPGQYRDDHPGRSVRYVLTTVDVGSGGVPASFRWEGEFKVPAPPSGPQEIVMPDDIGVGGYQLCSPYWTGDFFCYDLLVRPASAPWYVTAGESGVVLHDRDGTSQAVWEDPTRIAFWFEDLLVVESDSGAILAIRESDDAVEVTGSGGRLLDVARVEDSIKALIVRDEQTFLIDLYQKEETALGPAMIEGRVSDEVVVLRSAPTRIEARSISDGSLLWQLGIDPEEMISSVTETEVRLDEGQLTSESSPVPFWQYLETRIVDTVSGQVLDEFKFEIAVPLEGDQVTETCLRAELRDGLMLCPQPDGRLTTIEVEGGDQMTVAGVTDVIATYVR